MYGGHSVGRTGCTRILEGRGEGGVVCREDRVPGCQGVVRARCGQGRQGDRRAGCKGAGCREGRL
jgi:hypothetical protein